MPILDLLGDPTLFGYALMYSLLALSLYLTFACGLFSLANAGFMAIGAYAAGLLVTRLGVDPVTSTAAAVAASVVIAAVVAAPMLRLRDIYLALLTFGFGEMVYVVANNASFTGGQFGLSVPLRVENWGIVVALASVMLLVWRWRTSLYGRAADAVRQDETAAEAMAIPTHRYMIVSFIVSAAICGLAGSLWAQHTYFISPHDFGFDLILNLFLFVVVGGVYRWYGAVVGAFGLTYVIQALAPLTVWRPVVLGLIMTICIVLLPEGVTGFRFRRFRRKRTSRHGPEAVTSTRAVSR